MGYEPGADRPGEGGGVFAGGAGEAVGEIGIVAEAHDGGGERGRVVGRHQQSVLVGLYNFPNGRQVGGNQRPARGQVLKEFEG